MASSAILSTRVVSATRWVFSDVTTSPTFWTIISERLISSVWVWTEPRFVNISWKNYFFFVSQCVCVFRDINDSWVNWFLRKIHDDWRLWCPTLFILWFDWLTLSNFFLFSHIFSLNLFTHFMILSLSLNRCLSVMRFCRFAQLFYFILLGFDLVINGCFVHHLIKTWFCINYSGVLNRIKACIFLGCADEKWFLRTRLLFCMLSRFWLSTLNAKMCRIRRLIGISVILLCIKHLCRLQVLIDHIILRILR